MMVSQFVEMFDFVDLNMTSPSNDFMEYCKDDTSSATKIAASEYQKEGIYPIYDQSQDNVIAGFTDTASGLCEDYPAILFGDHSRIVKYIDRPFFIGADGVKIIRPTTNEIFPEFLYYDLLYHNIPNTGYNRHFKFVKMIKLTLPPLREQEKFLTFAHQADKSAFVNFKSQFVEMFGENGTVYCEQSTVSVVCSSIVRGPFGSALTVDSFIPKSENSFKVYEQKNAIQQSEKLGSYYISKDHFDRLKRFECQPKDIIMSCAGTIGRLFQLPDKIEKGIINQALCKFTINNQKVIDKYFIFYLRMNINDLETKGSGMKNIGSVPYIKNMPIKIPAIKYQKCFVEILEQADKSAYSAL